jgi:hypothetical protein
VLRRGAAQATDLMTSVRKAGSRLRATVVIERQGVSLEMVGGIVMARRSLAREI